MEQIRFPKSDGATDPYNSTAGRRGRSEEVSEAGADVARHGSPTSAPWKLEASRAPPCTRRAEQTRISHRLPEGPDVHSAGAFVLPSGVVVRSRTTMVAFSGPPASSCNCFARASACWRVLRMGLPWTLPGSLQTEKWPFEWQMITITILSTGALLAAWACAAAQH